MEDSTDPKRNVPAEKGRKYDPHVKDEDAIQPGLNTISDAPNDEANQHLTRTALDDFKEDSPGDEKADKRFDR